MTSPDPLFTLRTAPEIEPLLGGTVTYAAHSTEDGRCIGWIGDYRHWLGAAYGPQKWWASWSEAPDQETGWATGPRLDSRDEAVEALRRAVAGA